MLDLFISPAHAEGTESATVAPAAGTPAPPATLESTLMSFLPLFLIFMVFYFLLIRPQQKQRDQHLQMIKALRRGDSVVTDGGIVGTIHKVEGDDYVIVEIAENTRIKLLRHAVRSLVAKTEPASDTAPKA
jgi:preprotein translocase subunit YajC